MHTTIIPMVYFEGVEDVMLLILKFIILFIATFLSNTLILLIIAGVSHIILIKFLLNLLSNVAS
ncbi:hypothetical protein ACO3TA_02315 [Methanocaldococcus sp. 28A]